jgi:ribonuclease HII
LSEVICGVDEVGRGPLAGPVVAAAVVLDPGRVIDGLADSKKLTERRREQLFDEIVDKALAWSLGRAEVEEIDAINILQASLLAMQRAVSGLAVGPTLVLVDGNRAPEFGCAARAIVGGDGCEPCISAASIIAKVSRDREMVELDRRHPGYGLARHKGYPTKAHMEAIATLGVSEIHRRSFAPVRRFCP